MPRKMSENLTPSLLMVEQDPAAVPEPQPGEQRVFLNQGDHRAYVKDEFGEVAPLASDGSLGGAGGALYLFANFH